MKKFLSVALLALLAACSTPEPRPDPIKLDYTGLGKIMLNTQDLRIINRAQNTPQWAPYVGHTFQPTLIDAIQHMADDRLQAAGTLGHATLLIKDANVTEQSLNTASDFESLFTRQQATKLVGRVEVTLEAQSPVDASIGMTSAHAVYSVTLPEDPTENERYDAYRKLLTSLMNDLNKELDRGIKRHMGKFILSEGEIANPTPTRDSGFVR